MRKYYKRFLIVSSICFLINLYYSAIFCYIYSNSVEGWLNGTYSAAILDWFTVSFCIITLKAIVRFVLRHCYYLRFLIIIDYSFWILNFVL